MSTHARYSTVATPRIVGSFAPCPNFLSNIGPQAEKRRRDYKTAFETTCSISRWSALRSWSPFLQFICRYQASVSYSLASSPYRPTRLFPSNFPHAPSQVWMNRIGTAFAYGFKAALSTSLSFVLCQLMWLTLQRKFLTFSGLSPLNLRNI